MQRMRWKAFHFLKDKDKIEDTKETFGFKTRKTAPFVNELKDFKNDMIAMISDIKFDRKPNDFQKQLGRDARKINNKETLLVPADKTNNIYEVNKEHYEKLLGDSITAHYKKDNNNTEAKINKEAKKIVEKLEIAERVEVLAK
ncbi:MAG: hypothetical protein GY694_21640, partial [Gammaproteobacteria bacterium]|nr:hypothetical protein [Gammaproteobacteria bacterium]